MPLCSFLLVTGDQGLTGNHEDSMSLTRMVSLIFLTVMARLTPDIFT